MNTNANINRGELKNENGPSRLFQIELLFENEPIKPTPNFIFRAARKKFGDIDIISRDKNLTVFAVKRYSSYLKDATVPVQLCMGDIEKFTADKNISSFELSQIWNIENPAEIFDKCRYSLKISDMMAGGQIPKERAEMLVAWLEAALSLFPDCRAVWIKSSGKLQTADTIKNFKANSAAKFIHNMVNVRFFNIPDTNEFIVDTTGLAAVGLSDAQFHFKGLNPNKVANLAYNLAWYMLNDENIIKDGDTIDGLNGEGEMTPDVQWTCRYEDSLVEPLRPVLDIDTGKYAAGDRS